MIKVELKNVTKYIKKSKIIDNVSLCFESGKVYGLKGYNGSGKTMLIRLIIGLIYSTEGEALYNNKKIGKDIEFIKNVGFLLENPAFIGSYSGFENLQILGELKSGVSRENIENAMEMVGLGKEDFNKKYKKYSLGMKQKLALANVIIGDPDIMIFDEPTNALDKDGIELFKDIIKHYKSKNKLIIIASHDKEVLEELCDEIIELDRGKVISKEVIS